MANSPAEQSRAYREYFEIVRSFNSANAEYIAKVNDAISRRQTAINHAIEIHMNPLLSTVRSVRAVSAVVSVLSLLFFCGGCSAVQSASNSYQTAQTAAQSQVGGLVALLALGTGIVGVIVLSWTSSRISELLAKIREAQQSPPPNL